MQHNFMVDCQKKKANVFVLFFFNEVKMKCKIFIIYYDANFDLILK